MVNDSKVEIISQHIDTLKLHYYIDKKITDYDFNRLALVTNSLISLKKEVQDKKNDYQNIDDISFIIDGNKFNIMPTAITGFSVVVYNNDISIAIRKSKNKVNPSPILKVEFRAEFLARVGYLKATQIVNNFVSKGLLANYKINVSEIHLANDIQGYDFTHLDFYRMKSRARTRKTHEEETIEAKASVFGGLTTLTGYSFGGGDYHMRIYNKTKEITKFKKKEFAKYLLWENKSNYNADKTVWRLEIQIRRAKLKKLVNHQGTTLDNYENVLNAIPDLWSKALTDYAIKDIDDMDCFNMLRGKKTLKNGTEKALTKNAIYGIFKRADNLPFWEDLKVWNGHKANIVNTAFKIPLAGSQDYVSNSIKSLYSTMGKYYGSVSAKVIIQAFKDADRLNKEKKGISLLEDNFMKQIGFFNDVDYLRMNGVCNTPDYKDLENNIFQTVAEADFIIKNNTFSDDFLDKLEARKHTSKMIDLQLGTAEGSQEYYEAVNVFDMPNEALMLEAERVF